MSFSSSDSCRESFEKLKILSLQFQYIFSFLLFVIRNRELFRSDSDTIQTFICP